MQAGWLIAVAGMAILAIIDIKEKEIPVVYLIVFGIVAFIYAVVQAGMEWEPFFQSFLPGLFLLGVSLCTREGIGYGDGWTVIILGLLIGVDGCFITVCAGLVLTALVSLALLMLRKVDGKSRIPFLPFLAIGLGVGMIVQKGI